MKTFGMPKVFMCRTIHVIQYDYLYHFNLTTKLKYF
ncbi:hypothetical protein SAMN05421857_3364 [Chryseobacterium formosense]|nr:hypothetical protein SAMN05421857_3364 [Chryseobacterium formosense]